MPTYNQIISHTIIGVLALAIGYPYGGTAFIAAMIPYLMYIVFKNNAVFFPALILHCASETSATTVVFLSFILLSILNYRKLVRLKLSILFWILIGTLPIFAWLTWQRISLVGDYPPNAFSYIGYYISFFAFFYGVLIAKTFSKEVLMVIYYMLFIVFFLVLAELISFTRIIAAFTFLFIASLPIYLNFRNKDKVLLMLAIFSIGSLLSTSEESTFTMLFVSLTAFIITYLYLKKRTAIILKMTSIIPFVLIIILYFYGITNYMGTETVNSPEGIDLTSWSNFSDRLSFKFFGDRAPFWAGGFHQIMLYQPIFPIPDMPNIEAEMRSGAEIEITFGAHTSFIELIRKYGIFAGGLLCYSLIFIVIKSSKVFKIKKLNVYMVPFFSMAFMCTIILSLAGQFEMMPGYALLSFGVLGLAYYYSVTNSPNKT